jgi:hypothetical protein
MKLIEFRSRYSDPFYLLALLELCAIVDALMMLTSLGYVKTNFRASLLFSEWIHDQEEKHKTHNPFKKGPNK